jgi:hypothetical protein
MLLSSIVALFGLKKYTITESTLTISNYWHRVTSIISRSDLLSYYEDLHKDKNENVTGRTLRIKTTTDKINIRSYYYNNYEQLKIELIKGLNKDEAGELRSAKRWVIGFGVFFILFPGLLLSATWNDEFSNHEISNQDFIFIDGTVKSIIYAEHSRNKGRTTNYSIQLKLNEVGDFTFKMNDNIWSGEALKLTSQFFSAGDSISIALSKEDYSKKVSQISRLDFLDKHNNYQWIPFAAVNKNNNNILSLQTYINLKNEPAGFWTLLGAGFLILIFTAGCFFIYIAIDHKPKK